MKLQLAELTLEKKDGNEQTIMQRLKVSSVSHSSLKHALLNNRDRIYDLFCTNTNARLYIRDSQIQG